MSEDNKLKVAEVKMAVEAFFYLSQLKLEGQGAFILPEWFTNARALLSEKEVYEFYDKVFKSTLVEIKLTDLEYRLEEIKKELHSNPRIKTKDIFVQFSKKGISYSDKCLNGLSE